MARVPAGQPQPSIYSNPHFAGRTELIGIVEKQQGQETDLYLGEDASMLWTLFIVLLVLWLLGVVSSYTLGGFIHILLVLAVIALIFQLVGGRRTTI